MKFYIIIATCLIALTAIASEIKESRSVISQELQETINTLKEAFSLVENNIQEDKSDVIYLEQQAKNLVDESKELETNPTVLNHGKKNIASCDDAEELQWNNNAWECVKPLYAYDCIASSDEYRYQDNDGNWHCSKSPKGESITYYWQQRGYEVNCNSNNVKPAVFSCYYKNKNNEVIEVANSYCKSSKPSVAAKACPVNPTYSCPSGYSLSGNTCSKPSQCMYTSKEYRYGKYIGGVDSKCTGCVPRDMTCYVNNGQVLSFRYTGDYQKYFAPNDSGYYVGKKEYMSTGQSCGGGCCGAGYQVCIKGQTINATPSCPTGRTYNSSDKLCY